MSDPQEAATPSDPHSAEALVAYPPKISYLFEGEHDHNQLPRDAFIAGRVSRDAEVAELKAKIAELHPVEVWSRSWIAPHRPVGCPTCRTDGPCPTRQAVRGSASSPVEGGN